MKQKTKVFQLRLTPEEAQLLKEKSGSFHSVSHYILSAVQEFSNVDVKERIELIRELGEFYRKNQNPAISMRLCFQPSAKLRKR